MAGNSRIKGITVEIGGETTDLQNALKDVNKRSNALKSELKDVERLLKFDPGNVEALAQKQRILTQQIEATTEELDALRGAQEQVQRQFERGEINERQYRNFRREIEFTEASLNNMRQELQRVNNGNPIDEVTHDAQQAQNAVKDLGGEVAGVIGGLAAGGGIMGAVQESLDLSSLKTKIDIYFDVPEESQKEIEQAVKAIQTYGVDAEAALEGVRKQWSLNKDEADAMNSMIVRGAGAIASVYSEIDFSELIQETNEIAASLKISNENALALVDALLKAGFPPDQLDIIAEYGLQMKNAGFSLQEIQAIFEAGINTKSWNIDNLLDGVKETRIRMAEFGESIPKAVTDLLDGTGVNSKKISEWGQAVAEGGEKGSKALSDMVTWLSGIEDKAVQNAIATQLMGTMWEDQGQNLISVFQGVSTAVDQTTQNTNGLYETMGKVNADPAVELQQAIARMKEELQPTLLLIVDMVSKLSNWAAQNPKLTATIVAITTALTILIGIFMALMPIVVTITSLAGALGISVGAIASPVLIVIGVITALIAIGVLLYKNWDTVKARASQLGEKFPWLKAAFNSLTGPIQSVISIGKKLYNNWDEIMAKAGKLRDKVMNLFKGIDWKLPKVKLPHFKLSGNFDLMPPGISVPKLSVDWYKNGGVFPANSPQLIGVGDHPTAQEAVLPLSDNVLGKIAGMISDRMNGGGINITLNYGGLGGYDDAMTMVEIIERELSNRYGNNMRVSGVRKK